MYGISVGHASTQVPSYKNLVVSAHNMHWLAPGPEQCLQDESHPIAPILISFMYSFLICVQTPDDALIPLTKTASAYKSP